MIRCVSGWDRVCSSVCVPHPGGHASGGKSRDVVLKVDPSDADHVHLVCWVVKGAERETETLLYLRDLF